MGNSSDQTSTGAKKSITVSTQDGDVVVRRLALLDYAGLLRAFKMLPKELGKFLNDWDTEEAKNRSNIDTAMLILPLVADSWADFVAILAVPTDKDAEFIGALDGADALEILAAVLELNNYQRVVDTVKKLLPRKPEAQPPSAE